MGEPISVNCNEGEKPILTRWDCPRCHAKVPAYSYAHREVPSHSCVNGEVWPAPPVPASDDEVAELREDLADAEKRAGNAEIDVDIFGRLWNEARDEVATLRREAEARDAEVAELRACLHYITDGNYTQHEGCCPAMGVRGEDADEDDLVNCTCDGFDFYARIRAALGETEPT
jgi:hypothetical protein